MTDLRQVSGRNQINDFEQVFELECKYLENWRFSKDLRIGSCKNGRGRNAGRPAPPAQIPACATNAPGSCLR